MELYLNGLMLVLSLFPSEVYPVGGWCYKRASCGPSNWTSVSATCAGSRQSPIDIESMKALYDDKLTEIQLVNFDKTGGSESAIIKNNGHTVVVELPNSDYIIEGGGLLKSKLVQFHLHWGSTDQVGSEHTVDSKAFPMEVHFVAYADKYADFSTAVAKEDGLSVLGFFFEVGPSGNQQWADIGTLLGDIRYSGQNVTKPTFKPIDLVPSSRTAYFRYKGSLTTPNCNEVVTWTVFKTPIMITADVMTGFRSVFSNVKTACTNSTMSDNYRPVQPLATRKVTTSVSSRHALSATSTFVVTVLLSWATHVL